MVAACAAAQPNTGARKLTTPSSWTQTEPSVATLPGGTAVDAELNSSIDSRKVKVGEKVEAHATEEVDYAGKTIIPKGAKIQGHVTEASARSKGDSDSKLAIQFDKAIPKKGEEIPLNVLMLAVAAPQNDSFADSPGPGSDPMSGVGGAAAGGSPMGVGRPQAPPTGIPATAPGAPLDSSAEANRRAQLPASSRGVYGLKDLKLMMVSSKTSQNTVIVSSGKDVHLDGGTRLLLVAQPANVAVPGK